MLSAAPVSILRKPLFIFINLPMYNFLLLTSFYVIDYNVDCNRKTQGNNEFKKNMRII
ncbi:hypothetical protein ESP02_20900 [Enterococcus sp. NBRC 3427]|nr:hypothetical protein ESP02_20900 [Enterococcus sp. NBRC 3427]